MTTWHQRQQSIAKSNEKWTQSNKRQAKKPVFRRTYIYQGIPKATFTELAQILGEKHE